MPLLLAVYGLASIDEAMAQSLFVRVNSGGASTVYIYDTLNGTKSTFASGLPLGSFMACDSTGDLFVSDPNGGNVFEITPKGVKSTLASGLAVPTGLACDSEGNLFVACDGESGGGNGNGSIIEIALSSGMQSTFYSGLGNPSGLAFDSAGNLYEADSVNNGTIYKYTSSGMRSLFVNEFSNNGSDPDRYALAFDSTGNLFVADLSKPGLFEFTSGGAPSTFGSGLNEPTALAFDSAGDLFECDMGSGNINEFENDNGTLNSTYSTFVSGLNAPAGLVLQPVSPVPYGYGPFAASDPVYPFPQNPAIPFYCGLAYSQNNDCIYATTGPDPNPSDDNQDAFTYGIPSDLNVDEIVYLDVLDNPGSDYAYGFTSPLPTPTVASDGTTYVVTPLGALYSLRPDGTTNWVYFGISLDGANVFASPTIGLDGNVYVATDNGGFIYVLFCIDPELGLPKWELNYSTNNDDSDIDASPAATATGLYAENESSHFWYFTYYGQSYAPIAYPFYFEGYPSPSPAVTPQGFLCVGDADGHLNIVDPTPTELGGGGILWSCSLGNASSVVLSPVIGPDGNVYVGTSDGNFFAVQLPADERADPPTIIAKLSLPTSSSYSTTAAVGADSHVYFGTSADKQGDPPGSIYSVQLKPASDGPYPDEFVIDWQTNVSDGGFLGSPLIAQVGANHNNNVFYAPNTDGQIYAFLASAGPCTTTWSTFKGNDQRQDNVGNQSIPLPELWNVQFGLSGGQLQTGKAAYGNNANDYWNAITVQNGSNPPYTLYDYADKQSSPEVGVTISSTTGLYDGNVTSGAFHDNLMQQYMDSQNPQGQGQITIAVSGLPTTPLNNRLLNGGQALYDVYVYAYGGQDADGYYNSTISISPTGTDPVKLATEYQKTTCQAKAGAIEQAPPTDLFHFTQNFDDEVNDYENGEYVVFHNVPLTTEQNVITITVTADSGNQSSFPMINGIQIVAKQ